MLMRNFFYIVAASVGAWVGNYIGDYSPIFISLCIFMAVDYFSGLAVAFIFHNSPKTEYGRGESKICFKGIVKKFFMLIMVGMANRIDIVLGTNYVRTGVMFALMFNESVSILENFGLMGIDIPAPLKNALEILNKSGEKA